MSPYPYPTYAQRCDLALRLADDLCLSHAAAAPRYGLSREIVRDAANLRAFAPDIYEEAVAGSLKTIHLAECVAAARTRGAALERAVRAGKLQGSACRGALPARILRGEFDGAA